MKTLYIFIDESGNFDFSSSGTKYFILTALSTTNPFDIGKSLLKLRYDLLPNYACGPKMEESGYFHASEDTQAVRDNVFEILTHTDHNFRVDAVVAQKNKANPKFHTQPVELYKKMGEAFLKYVLKQLSENECDHIVLIFSSIFDRKKRGILKQAFKSLIKSMANISFALYFHDSKFDLCNQAVDYYGWAIYRHWDSADERSFNLVKHQIKSNFSIFRTGINEYYQYK